MKDRGIFVDRGIPGTKEFSQVLLDKLFMKRFCSASRSKEITEKIVNMIVIDMHPIRTVECADFKELIHLLEQGYVLPSSKTVKT